METDEMFLRIMKIIEDCDNLQADDTMVVTEFGKGRNLTLCIKKDEDYDPETDSCAYNMVNIATRCNDAVVDDTGDVHISDLYFELVRIYQCKHLCLS